MDLKSVPAAFVLVFAVALFGAPHAASAQPAGEPPIFQARELNWARKPTPYEFARTYPDEAQRHSVVGRGVVTCTIGAELNLTDCQIVEETPPGHGFGDAAISLARLFKLRAKQADPRVVPGAKVFLPIVFNLPAR